MLQRPLSEPLSPYSEDDRDGGVDLARYYLVLKKRLFYLIVPFVLVLVAGVLVTAIQRPVFVSEAKILISSEAIPVDLVRPTVSSAASERIQVIQQRIMTRDNLLAIVNKYGLFPSQSKWMSASQLLDLMRERTHIQLIEVSSTRQVATIAFTVGFEYETPDIAAKVANEVVTLILNEDARTRTNRAVETTKFLSREVARLEGELGSVEGKIADLRRRQAENSIASGVAGLGVSNGTRDPLLAELATLKADLLQKSSVYSSEHPEVKKLKLKIAALEKTVSQATRTTDGSKGAKAGGSDKTAPDATDATEKLALDALDQRRKELNEGLDDANRKLTAARLGESLERDQQSERLEVIEQPTAPQKPVRPNKSKLLALSLIAAAMAGVGAVFAREMFDRSIRGSYQLLGVVDAHLLVAIPYISTRSEALRRKRTQTLGLAVSALILVLGLSLGLYLGLLPTELTALDASWLDRLRSLSK